MKTTYKDIWREINKHNKITIVSHVDPDGDTIGSAIALKHLILDNTNISQVKISSEKAPRYIEFIDESETISDQYFYDSQVIVVDTSTKSRIFDKRVKTQEAIKIDHHHKEEKWKMEIGGDFWPATGQILYEMVQALNLKISKKSAEAMWIAIWTDTEGMTQRNINKITSEAINKLVPDPSNLISQMVLLPSERNHINDLKNKLIIKNNVCSLITDDIVPNDYIRQMTGEFSNQKGFEIYIGITKVKENLYRGEIRSKGNIDVSVFAKKFGGGGHYSSAGFQVHDFNKAQEYIDYLKSIGL